MVYDMVYGMVWYGMVWYGMVWYGMVWYGMVWYGMWCRCSPAENAIRTHLSVLQRSILSQQLLLSKPAGFTLQCYWFRNLCCLLHFEIERNKRTFFFLGICIYRRRNSWWSVRQVVWLQRQWK